MPDTGWLGPKTDQVIRASGLAPQTTGGIARASRRYDKPRGDQQIIQRGNQQIVMHYRRQVHVLVPIGAGMALCLVFIVIIQIVSGFVGGWQADSQYGYPRTHRTSVVVGHGDSEEKPSHFIFQNINGQISIIEMSGGDPSRGRIYKGPTLLGDGMDRVPVTGEFADENGDGKLDMIVIVQNQRIVYLNDGKEFKQQ